MLRARLVTAKDLYLPTRLVWSERRVQGDAPVGTYDLQPLPPSGGDAARDEREPLVELQDTGNLPVRPVLVEMSESRRPAWLDAESESQFAHAVTAYVAQRAATEGAHAPHVLRVVEAVPELRDRLAHFSHDVFPKQLRQADCLRVEPVHKALHQSEARASRGLDGPLGSPGVQGERLLAEDVLASFEGL